jgi:hypothetical protein
MCRVVVDDERSQQAASAFTAIHGYNTLNT